MTAEDRPETLDDLSDEALLRAIAERADRSAFVEIFQRFAGRVKAFMMRSGAGPDVAEEIAQEVMVTVWRKAARFDAARAGAATWIFTIARNRRIDRFRRESRAEPDPNDPLFQPEPEADPAETAARTDRDDHVRRAVAALSEDQREVVRLAFYAGLSHGEIAETLGTPLGTVKSRLRLSFTKLRGALGEDFSMELIDE